MQKVNVGDTLFIPAHLNEGEKCMAKVVEIYNRFILLEKNDKMKLTVQISDLPHGVEIVNGSEETKEMENDILQNI